MTVVLGIDAAWTARNPSGVAVVAGEPERWRSVAVAPSYATFLALAQGQNLNWATGRLEVGERAVAPVLKAARRLASAKVDVVAVDMPLATVPITGRRAADNAISSRFSRLKCATHSPSSARFPVLDGRTLSEFQAEGFMLAIGPSPSGGRVIEVYPHPALVTLCSAPCRLEYKAGRMSSYWPRAHPRQRLGKLLKVWRRIREALGTEIQEIGLPEPESFAGAAAGLLKRYEDALDALVCAWVGCCFVEGRAVSYGDETAAIWVPIARC